LNKQYNRFQDLHVAIGCDFGRTLLSRLGVRGDLDCACVGLGTLGAEALQLSMAGNQIGISADVYDTIDDDSIKSTFVYSESLNAYIAKHVTWISLEDEEQATAFNASSSAGYTAGGKILVGNDLSRDTRPLKVTRPWSDES